METSGDLPSVFYQDLAKQSQNNDPYAQPQQQLDRINQQQQQQQQQSTNQSPQQQQQQQQAQQNGQSSFGRSGNRPAQPSRNSVANVRSTGQQQVGQPQNSQVQQQQQPTPNTDNLLPIPRAAKTVNDYLAQDARYPDMETILTQGVSYECSPAPEEWTPFMRTASYQIPDQIFEQYNQVEVVTKMGLFAEIGRAWITVDNKLFLWNFSGGDDFQCFDDQSNNILSVKLVKPRPGVFVDTVTHVLLVATEFDIFILGVSATPNGRPNNGRDVTLYNTKMSVPVKGLNVMTMVGSAKTGRIFFSGEHDEDVYELTYQVWMDLLSFFGIVLTG